MCRRMSFERRMSCDGEEGVILLSLIGCPRFCHPFHKCDRIRWISNAVGLFYFTGVPQLEGKARSGILCVLTTENLDKI